MVIDPYNPRVLTFDPWTQYVFIAANGQMTITEYVYYMADKYSGYIPNGQNMNSNYREVNESNGSLVPISFIRNNLASYII